MTDNSAQGPTFKDVRNFDSTKCQMFTTYDTKQKNFTKISSRIRIYFLVPVASTTRKVKQLENFKSRYFQLSNIIIYDIIEFNVKFISPP